MAEFCKQCAEELDFEPDFTDLFIQDGTEPDPEGNIGFPTLCETCGPAFIIDNEGTCGAFHCNGSLHGDGAHRKLT